MNTQNIIFTIIAIAIIIIVVWVGGTKKTPIATIITEPVTTENVLPAETKTETNTIKKMTTVTMTTNKGAITIELSPDTKPKTVENL